MLSFRERNPRMRFRIYWDQWHDWLLPKVLKSLEDVGQKESFLKFMGLIASGTFPLHNICYLLFLDIVEWFRAIQPHIWDMDTKPLSFGKLDIGYFMENSSALCSGSATLDRFWMEHRRKVFLIRWNLRWTVPYQMGFTSENLITNTAAVALLWIWVHLFYKRYVQKGPVNSSSSISSMILNWRSWHFCLKKGKDRL